MEDEDHCLCVLLYARDGPTFRWKGAKAGAAAGDGEKGSNNLGQNKKVSLFSGYVPYSHLRGATSKQGRGAGFLGMSTSSQAQPEQPEKLVMRGPGGKGHAEVAVTLLNRTTVVQPEEPKAEEKVSPTRSVNLSPRPCPRRDRAADALPRPPSRRTKSGRRASRGFSRQRCRETSACPSSAGRGPAPPHRRSPTTSGAA